MLAVGAATAAAATAVGGALWMWAGGDLGRAGGGSPAAGATSFGPRIDCAQEGQLPGSGATAQYSAMRWWIEEYQWACPGAQVAYKPLSSGGGVAQFMQGVTAFGSTDGALTPDEVEQSRDVCPGGRGIDLPMAGGAIAIGYNLPGVDDLVLDAPVLAKIFDSRIERWDAPAIRKLNPRADLPDLPIHAVHRLDASGTTENFSAYLAASAPRLWPYPASKSWQARDGHSAQGPEGVASQVAATKGAVGYLVLPSASASGIPTARIDTGAREPVTPSPKTASAALARAQVVGTGKDVTLRFDYSTRDADTYPIVLVTYEIMCDKGNRAAILPILKSFLAYTAGEEGQKVLPALDYAPLPEHIAARVRATIRTLS